MEKKAKKEEKTIDIGIGLGGIFKGLGDIIELVSDLAEKQESVSRAGEFKIKGLGDKAKGVFGFTVKTGIGGEPVLERFGNIRETKAGPVVEEEREPIIDVFDEKDRLLVVVELPGVEEENIKLDIEGDNLIITAKQKERSYSRKVALPARVRAAKMKTTYKNGVLEIILPKPKEKSS